VTRISNALGYVDVTVRVPPGSEGEQPVRVTSRGRTAVGSLTYYQPPLEIRTVRWCPQCNGRFCLSNGMCVDTQTEPRENTAPRSGKGSVVLVVDNMPVVAFDAQTGALDASSSVIVDFGGESVLRRVSYSTVIRTELEFYLPKLEAAQGGTYQLSVKTPASPVTYTARFSFSFYEDSINASCVPACVAPSYGSSPLSVTLTNFLVPAGNPTDLLAVSFGSVAAASVSVVSTNRSLTVLSITPPSCSQFKANPSISGATRFTFWAAPQVSSARFDPIGTLIVVRFDQTTNRAGMTATDNTCGMVFSAESVALLGSSGLVCVWRADNVLEVKLGTGATVTPGSQLNVQGARSIRSSNAVSPACTSRFTVQLPEVPVRPTIIVSGTSVVDRCSQTSIEATSNSPRSLNYTWSSNNDAISEQLRGQTGSRPVYDLRVLDTQVSVFVYGVDFLRQASEIAEFVVLRQSSAVPQITFFPPVTVTYAEQDVLVTAQAEFSSCKMPETTLIFEWRQIKATNTDPTIPAGENFSRIRPCVHVLCTYTIVHMPVSQVLRQHLCIYIYIYIHICMNVYEHPCSNAILILCTLHNKHYFLSNAATLVQLFIL
jgi:hypothetical protein